MISTTTGGHHVKAFFHATGLCNWSK